MFQGLGCFFASRDSCFCSRVVVSGGPRMSGFYADTRVGGRSYWFSGGVMIFGVTLLRFCVNHVFSVRCLSIVL